MRSAYPAMTTIRSWALGHWDIGALARWRSGALGHWSIWGIGGIGALAHWRMGALGHWGVGAVGHLAGERVVHEDVGALLVWREAPDGARGEKVPVVPLLKEGAELLAVPAHRDEAVLDVLGEALLERLGDHGQLRAAVGCLGEAPARG